MLGYKITMEILHSFFIAIFVSLLALSFRKVMEWNTYDPLLNIF